MREIKSCIRRIICLEWLRSPKTHVFIFWIGIIYIISAVTYHFLFFGFGAALNYLFGADISVVIGPLITIAGLVLNYLQQARQREIEEILKEIELSPIDKAREMFIKYYPKADREGWSGRLSGVVNKRWEEFSQEVLKNKDTELLENLEKILESEIKKGNEFNFLKIYVKEKRERADWNNLLENLPEWLKNLGEKDNWRKAIYEEAAKCAYNVTLVELWEKWFKQEYGRMLLRVPRMWENLTDDQRKSLGPRVEILWPKLRKRPESLDIEKWRSFWRLNFNPFGPVYAEEDPLLPDYYIEPDFWNSFLAPHPALVLGPYGSGKSALAIYLINYLRENYKASQGKTLGIPLYVIKPFSDSLIFSIAETFALRTLELAAHNPFIFLESPQKTHFYRLWKLFIPDVKAILAVERLSESLLTLFMKEMESLEPIHKTIQLSPQRLEDLISPCVPPLEEFEHIYLIVDVKDLTVKSNELINWLETWVTIMPLLLRINFYPKIICPGDANVVPVYGWEWDVFKLKWDKTKLSRMVETRMVKAGIDSFNALFDPSLRGIDWALELAKAAKGSPKQLIHMGNKILLNAEKHLPYIIANDLVGILL
ncbi:MAG: hypothetical protein QXQ50_06995 [Candidatus Bathyarchaeia archaeon]